jgi:hypothetical protein
MVTSDFVEIAACANAVEAEQIRSVLDQHGVAAFVDGAAANTALSYVGTALGGVRVLVSATDAARAAEIVETGRDESNIMHSPWYCGQCHETIDGSFELCWSCGNAREDVERPLPDTGEEVHFESEPEECDEIAATTLDYSGYDESNPYASPMTPANSERQNEKRPEINEEAEAMLLRAWRASIIGTVCLPFVMHLYSMYLLIRAANTAAVLSPSGERRFYRAFAVNVVAGCVWGLMIHAIIR